MKRLFIHAKVLKVVFTSLYIVRGTYGTNVYPLINQNKSIRPVV